MKIKNIKFRKAFLLLLWFFTLILLFPQNIEAKSYSIPRDKYDIAINQDKSVDVVEYLSYDFDGSFSWAEMWIPTKISRQGYNYSSKITNFSIHTSDKSPILFLEKRQESNRFYAKWGYTARNESKRFIISYTIENAIRKYPETAELYWQIIGKDWKVSHKNIEAIVKLPEKVDSQKNILVFGHGPLTGKAEILDAQRVRFTADRVSAGQFMEIRVVFPTFLATGKTDANISKEDIKKEEKRFVAQTINAAKRKQQSAKLMSVLFSIWAGLVAVSPIVWIAIWFFVWKKYGKEYPTHSIPKYVRMLPSSLPPAEVDALIRQEADPQVASFTATIFDLARKGYIKIKDKISLKSGLLTTRKKIKTSLAYQPDTYTIKTHHLKKYEKDLIRLLFGKIAKAPPNFWEQFIGSQTAKENKSDNIVTLKEIRQYLKSNKPAFQKWFKKWKREIKKEVKSLNLLDPKSQKAFTFMWIGSAVFAILTFNPIPIVLAAILAKHLKRWSKKWVIEAKNWKAFKKFLDDFSNFKTLPPEAYKLWEHYLVFGILFGNAKKIIKMLPIILKSPSAAPGMWYYYGTTAGIRNINTSSKSLSSVAQSLNTMASELQTASTSAAHYSSGGGGGFSSGGGGAGGGGGGGAG